ncbi:hypothetical protein M422DRAFT_36376 [Sphaerobolus stellatus SS14]|uniref:Uncharacterized protein n=1 Tax=Sphaerobolus stellatus (strain SS14) TaxID=990650 RepID=A0A0C9TM20_SPHS4|nr:hypothetical protein M422DRAFT_36376 [Sphaerobolus stellatus SS14]
MTLLAFFYFVSVSQLSPLHLFLSMADDPPRKGCPGRPPKKRRLPRDFFMGRLADSNIPIATVTGSLTDKLGVYSSQIPPLTLTETLQLPLTLGQSTALAFHVRPATISNNARGFLSKISRGAPAWKLIAQVRTLDLSCSLVDILWFGHPIDSPYDPRARQFLVMWKDPSELSEEAKEFAKKEKEVVCRWNLYCARIRGYEMPLAHPGATALNPITLEIPPVLDQDEGAQEIIFTNEPSDIPQKGAYCNEKVQLVV